MFTTLAETYMTAARVDTMFGRTHPEATRIAQMAAESAAKVARYEEALREAERRERGTAWRRLAGRALTGAGGALSRLGERIGPARGACCP